MNSKATYQLTTCHRHTLPIQIQENFKETHLHDTYLSQTCINPYTMIPKSSKIGEPLIHHARFPNKEFFGLGKYSHALRERIIVPSVTNKLPSIMTK